jgi:transcriptional regulator with XRE-family HTH domain
MEHFLAHNIKHLRNKKGWTQGDLADRLGIKRSRIGAYEEGRAEPKISDLQLLAMLFGIRLDTLVGEDLSSNPNKDTLYEKSSGQNLRLLSVVVDKEGEEQVVVVPAKAAAGYLNHYEDIDNYSELPTFQLPLPEIYSGRTHRVFQIEGDSMLPMPSGAYVLTRYLENWQTIKDGQPCIVVSRSEGLVYKRIENKIEQEFKLILHSDNKIYPNIEANVDDIMEIWEAVGFISFQLPGPNPESVGIDQLAQAVLKLQADIDQIKRKVD